MSPILRSFVLLAGASAPLFADPMPYPPAAVRMHDYFAPDGVEGRAVAGRFDDNAVLDVVQCVSGVPTLVRDVETLGSFHAFESAVNDLDVWPGGAPNGRDALVVVDGAGLHRLHFDDATRSFVATSLATTGAWVDADFVRTGDVDGDGKVDAVGLSGTTVVIRPDLADESETSDGWSLPAAGHALALFDPTGGGTDVLAIADGAGITLRDAAGTPTSTAFPAATYRELRPVPAAGGGELLAALTTLPATGDQYLHVGGTTLDSSLLLGNVLDVVSAAPTVLAPGEPADLILSSRQAPELVVFRHTESLPAYSIYNFTDNFLIVPCDDAFTPNATTSASRSSTLVPLDADGDGDQGLFQFDSALAVFRVVRNELIDETDWRPGVALLTWTFTGAQGETAEIDWDVTAPATIEASATALELSVYRVPLPEELEEELHPVLVEKETVDVEGGTIRTVLTRDDDEALTFIGIVRQVEVDSTGRQVRAWPTHTFSFTVEGIVGGDPVPVNGPITRPNGGESEPPPPPPPPPGGGE